jgi:peptidoglycan/LPS O-acetylase OafA/YrhL
MSAAAFAVVVGYVLIHGAAREADEGAAAHIWQLLVGAQLPLVAFFVIKWLPRVPRAALCVLGLQLAALLVAAAPVFFLHL